MPIQVLDHNTGMVYLPDSNGFPLPQPELNSVTFLSETGAAHTFHYHQSQEFDNPREAILAGYEGNLRTTPPEPREDAQEDDREKGGGD